MYLKDRVVLLELHRHTGIGENNYTASRAISCNTLRHNNKDPLREME